MKDYLTRKLSGSFSTKEEILALINVVKQNKDKIKDDKFFKEINTKLYNKLTEFGNNYKDKNDQNALNWGGVRSNKSFFEHPFQTVPMFFRANGSAVDLINMYQNQAVFLISNGPSFKDVDHSKLKLPGIVSFGMNNGAKTFKPTLWGCVDEPSRFMKEIWEDATITKIVPQAHFEKPLWDHTTNNFSEKKVKDCSPVFGYRRNESFDPKSFLFESSVNWGEHGDRGGGRSVMLSSIRICHLLGFRRVYLLGADFNMTENYTYFFEEQRTKGAVSNNQYTYGKLIERFTELKPIFDQYDFKIYNLNPKSNLKVFPFMNFDEAIDREKVDTSGSTYGMYVDRKKGSND